MVNADAVKSALARHHESGPIEHIQVRASPGEVHIGVLSLTETQADADAADRNEGRFVVTQLPVGTAVSDRADAEEVIAVMMAAVEALHRATLALSAALGEPGAHGDSGLHGAPGLPGDRVELAAPTGREVEVALLVGSGHSNQQIARRLCVSVRTVEAHLSHIYRKLRVESRLGLCRLIAT